MVTEAEEACGVVGAAHEEWRVVLCVNVYMCVRVYVPCEREK